MGLLSTLAVAIVGAIVGALITGVISYCLARQSAKIAAEAARAERLAKKKAIGLRVIVKVKLLTDTAYSLHKTIEGGIAEAERVGVKGPLVFRLPPVAGHPEGGGIEFEAEELALPLEANEHDLLNELMLMSARQKTLEVSLRDYSARKLDLMKMLPAPVMNGPVGSHFPTEAERAKIAPFVVDLEPLAQGIRDTAAEQLAKCQVISGRIGPVLRKLFADPGFPTLALRDDL